MALDYQIKSGFEAMDFSAITELLAKTYWVEGIKIEEVIDSAENSALLVGAFKPDNQQIGYARVISDKNRFAYILDVVVDENYRQQGIGQSLINAILNHPDLNKVYQWLLITKDAHGVYAKSGFKPVARPDDWMEIRNPRPVR